MLDMETPSATPWMQWVISVIEPDDPATAARRAGFDKSAMTRWKGGTAPDPERAVSLARAYDVHPVEALVAMGLLTEEEGAQAPESAQDVIRRADPEALANELVARIRRASADPPRTERRKRGSAHGS